MRNQTHLQERHLLEAVRRRVITEEQMHELLAVARGMEPGAGAAPDLRWVTALHGAIAFALVGASSVYLLSKMERIPGASFAALCALAAAVAWGAGLVVRRAGWGRVPAAVLTAGAVALSWGVGAGLYFAARAGTQVVFSQQYGYSGWQLQRLQANATVVGDLTVIVLALLLRYRARVAAVAAPAALAFVHLVGAFAQQLLAEDGWLSERELAPYWLGAAVVLLAVGYALDDKRDRLDPAFWIHFVGLATVGFVGLIRIDHEPGEGLLWSGLAVVLAALGLRQKRGVYLLAAAGALVIFPAFSLTQAHAEAELCVGVLVGSCLVVAIGAAWLRRRQVAQWLEGGEAAPERTAFE